MKSAATVLAFVVWLVAVMALTILMLRLNQGLEAAHDEQVEALVRSGGERTDEVARHEEKALAARNLFSTVAILLVGMLALGLVVFTVWAYRLAVAAREARELAEFRRAVPAATEAPASGPDLREPRPPAKEPAQDEGAEAERAANQMPRDAVFGALRPPDAERQYRFDLVREAGLRFPGIAADLRQLLKLAGKPETYMHQLVREISKRPALAPKLVRLANTLYYSPPKPAKNLNLALVVLGAEGLRSAVLLEAVRGSFESFGNVQRELWRHSIGAAIAAGLVARAVRLGKPDDLYACGLFHDFGKIVLVNNRPDEYAKLVEIMHSDDVPACDVEREAFGFSHAEVGAVALAFSGLPSGMQAAVMYHHDLGAPGLASFGREAVVAATILNAADAIAKKTLGVGATTRDEALDLVALPAVRGLDLTKGQVAEVCEDLRDVYAEQETFL